MHTTRAAASTCMLTADSWAVLSGLQDEHGPWPSANALAHKCIMLVQLFQEFRPLGASQALVLLVQD